MKKPNIITQLFLTFLLVFSLVQVNIGYAALASAPAWVKATMIDSTNIEVQWAEVIDATDYKIQVDGVDYLSMGGAVLTRVGINSLTPDTTYTVGVAAVTTAGTSDFTTMTVQTSAPSTPSSLTLDNLGPTRAKITWTASANATEYKILVNGSENIILSADTATYTVPSLMPGTAYQIGVVASNGAGSSTAKTINFTTPQNNAPTNVRATQIGLNEVEFTWDAIFGVDHYKIQVNGVNYGQTIDGNTNSFVVKDRIAGSTYNLGVAAFTDVGLSSYGVTPVTMKTAPTGFTFTGVSPVDILFKWDPMFDAKGYRIQLNGVDQGVQLDANTTSYRATNLQPNTSYNVGVAAVSNKNVTSAYTVKTISTQPLSAPSNLQAITGMQEAKLTWSPVFGASSYRVKYNGWVFATTTTNEVTRYGLDYSVSNILCVETVFSPTVISPSSCVNVTPLSEVSGLMPTAIGPTQIAMTWNGIYDAKEYQVKVNGVNYGAPIPAGTTSALIQNLTPGSSYQIGVQAIARSGMLSNTKVVGVATALQSFALNPTAIQIGTNRAEITWNSLFGCTYDVTVNGVLYKNVTTNRIVVEGLRTNSQYNIGVAIVNSYGKGPVHSTYPTTQSAPQNFIPVQGTLTPTSVTVQWTPVYGASKYTVRVNGVDYNTNVTSNTLKIEGLTAGSTNNQIAVAAVDSSATALSTTGNTSNFVYMSISMPQ